MSLPSRPPLIKTANVAPCATCSCGLTWPFSLAVFFLRNGSFRQETGVDSQAYESSILRKFLVNFSRKGQSAKICKVIMWGVASSLLFLAFKQLFVVGGSLVRLPLIGFLALAKGWPRGNPSCRHPLCPSFHSQRTLRFGL